MIGQDNQQVLVKHGSIYIHVNPCRLRLVNQDSSVITEFSEKIVEMNEKKSVWKRILIVTMMKQKIQQMT